MTWGEKPQHIWKTLHSYEILPQHLSSCRNGYLTRSNEYEIPHIIIGKIDEVSRILNTTSNSSFYVGRLEIGKLMSFDYYFKAVKKHTAIKKLNINIA